VKFFVFGLLIKGLQQKVSVTGHMGRPSSRKHFELIYFGYEYSYKDSLCGVIYQLVFVTFNSVMSSKMLDRAFGRYLVRINPHITGP
jgi:hypothetical protein